MTTRTYPQPVNFQTASGAWKAIDPTLEAGPSGTVEPADLDGNVRIPSTLSKPIEVTHDGQSMTLRLHGTADDPAGDRSTAGAKAVFDDALDGVTVKYTARAEGLKETLVLDSASAPRTFSYDLTAPSDLTAAIDAGGDLVMSDASGAQKFRVSAPLAWDSANPTEYSDALSLAVDKTSAGHWTLSMKVSDAWLSDPARVYPVSVDPDFYWINASTERFHGANQDCYLSGGVQAAISYCAATTLAVGYYNRPYRANLRFDLASVIPASASITNAQLAMFLPGTTTHAAINSRVHTITSDWDNNATWNNRKTSTPWSTSGGGGDVSTAANLTGTVNPSVGNGGYWYYWNVPLAAIQGWVTGSLPNYGLQVSADSEVAATNAYSFVSTDGDQANWPALDVTWSPSATDTVAPAAPSNIRVADADPVTRTALVYFDEGVDTAQAGVAASGLDYSEYRVAKRGGTFSAWTSTPVSTFTVTDIAEGEQLVVETRSRDKAGNISSSTSRTFTTFVDPADATALRVLASQQLATQLGVTPAVALSWLALQPTLHTALNSLDGSAAGDTIAGLRFDNATRTAHVQLLNTTYQADVAAAVAAQGIQSGVVYDIAAYSWPRLDQAAAQAGHSLASLVGQGKVLVRIKSDLSGLSIFYASSLSTTDKSLVTSTATGLGVPATTSSVAYDPRPTGDPAAGECNYPAESITGQGIAKEFPQDPDFTISQCSGTIRGGVAISPGNTNSPYTSFPGLVCSAGFTAIGDDGNPYMLTAGHCGYTGSSNTWWQVSKPTPVDGVKLGSVATGNVAYNGFFAPGATNPTADFHDAQAISLTAPPANQRLTPYVHFRGAANPLSRVTGVGHLHDHNAMDTAPGETVCTLGARTGPHCVPVLDVYTTNFAGSTNTDDARSHQVAINTCAVRPGDSGGAVITPDHLAVGLVDSIAYQGVMNGHTPGAGDAYFGGLQNELGFAGALCPDGGRGYANIVPVDEQAAALHMRVLTTRWQQPKSTAVRTGDFVRATATWNQPVDIDLWTWDANGNRAGYFTPAAIPGAQLLGDNTTGYGPEEFVERTNVGRAYTVAVCYFNGKGATTVDVELRNPDGTSRTTTVKLGGPGSTAIIGQTPSTAPAVSTGTTTDWCPSPGSGGGGNAQ